MRYTLKEKRLRLLGLLQFFLTSKNLYSALLGAFAIYLEPWHADIFDFLDLRNNHGKEENRARDLLYTILIPDLFLERVQSSEEWSLFCPNEAPGWLIAGKMSSRICTRNMKESNRWRMAKSCAPSPFSQPPHTRFLLSSSLVCP